MTMINAAAVKSLREKTGAGMMDCKRALQESAGDVEQAQDWLRAKGLSRAARKAGRTAAEGLIGLAVSGGSAALVEVNSETDFVARNEAFQSAVREIAEAAARNNGERDKVLAAPAIDGNGNIDQMLGRLAGTIGENIQLRNSVGVSGTVVSGYIHAQTAPGLGRIGVIVALDGEGEAIVDLAYKIAMHIAASRPLAVSRDDIDPAVVAREKKILTEQAEQSGRPAAVIEKMIEGRLQKFFRESVLLEQAFIMDPEQSIGALADAAGVKIIDFAVLVLGEGVEKEQSSFADEVAQLGGAG